MRHTPLPTDISEVTAAGSALTRRPVIYYQFSATTGVTLPEWHRLILHHHTSADIPFPIIDPKLEIVLPKAVTDFFFDVLFRGGSCSLFSNYSSSPIIFLSPFLKLWSCRVLFVRVSSVLECVFL